MSALLLGAGIAHDAAAQRLIQIRDEAAEEVAHALVARMDAALRCDLATVDTERLRLHIAAGRFDYCNERLREMAAAGGVTC